MTGVLIILGVLGLAGCGTAPEPPTIVGAPPSSAPPSGAPSALKPSRWPPSAAGGACPMLDYAVVEQAIGVSFEVAAGGQQDATQTCVLQLAGATSPDLTLAVTPSGADAAVFRSTVMPKGAAQLTGLGKAGYQSPVAAAPDAGRGPGAEIGWLSGDNRILVLRATLAADADPQAAADLGGRLVELAKTLEQPPA